MPVDLPSKQSRSVKMRRDNTPQLTSWPLPRLELVVQLGVAAGVDSFCLTTGGREVLINVLELTVLGEQILPRSAVDSLLNHASTVSGLGRIPLASEESAPDQKVTKLSPLRL